MTSSICPRRSVKGEVLNLSYRSQVYPPDNHGRLQVPSGMYDLLDLFLHSVGVAVPKVVLTFKDVFKLEGVSLLFMPADAGTHG